MVHPLKSLRCGFSNLISPQLEIFCVKTVIICMDETGIMEGIGINNLYIELAETKTAIKKYPESRI
jgi:hypothetical protein